MGNTKQLERVQGRMGFARRAPGEGADEYTPAGYGIPFVDHDVTIRNARPIVDELSLDREGFTLIQHKVSCANERDPAILRKNYLEEMVPFIKDYFNASWVTTADLGGVVIRSIGGSNSFPGGSVTDAMDSANKRSVRSFGAGFAHIDFSPVAGPMIAARDNQLQNIEIRSYSRLMIIQTWRVLSQPPHDFPLAFCDGSSILDADLVDASQTKYGATVRAWIPHYNPSQRWYYIPDMTPDELYLFKGYDSDMHYRPWSAHSAFDNRRAYPNAKPRESIETRFYVYYE
ncbi:CmcJ/NvfI family oxidoreductase [Bradyrhizobium altum]|uniref:CmcJ/NvfI family oxidoreductase n=1 Tax=Bradyrhizobium altum TaxID=1571202 RepID=UPI001E4C4528|nr:CmcJ/NvfI family oxidoreductase [Bradyrhizobium altum]